MPSVFGADREAVLRGALDYLHVRYNAHRPGWQKVSCPGPAHAHGDRNPSASVNVAAGKFFCHACGLHGDGFDLMLVVAEMPATEVMRLLSISPEKEVDEWLL